MHCDPSSKLPAVTSVLFPETQPIVLIQYKNGSLQKDTRTAKIPVSRNQKRTITEVGLQVFEMYLKRTLIACLPCLYVAIVPTSDIPNLLSLVPLILAKLYHSWS